MLTATTSSTLGEMIINTGQQMTVKVSNCLQRVQMARPRNPQSSELNRAETKTLHRPTTSSGSETSEGFGNLDSLFSANKGRIQSIRIFDSNQPSTWNLQPKKGLE